VALTSGASDDSTNSPRCLETLNVFPSNACAAVAPRQTTTRGFTSRGGLRVDAAFAARFPFEMLHNVRHINGRAIDSGLLERAVEQLSRRADERMPSKILGVPRLLADQHDFGPLRPFTEYGLRAALVEVAGLASRGHRAHAVDRRPVRQQVRHWLAGLR
jgi:hypothetical protein